MATEYFYEITSNQLVIGNYSHDTWLVAHGYCPFPYNLFTFSIQVKFCRA